MVTLLPDGADDTVTFQPNVQSNQPKRKIQNRKLCKGLEGGFLSVDGDRLIIIITENSILSFAPAKEGKR